VINFRASRGGSGVLYSQSAVVRVMSVLDAALGSLPLGSGDEVRVLRNRSLWIVSGSEGSSTKQSTFVCSEGARMEPWNKVTCWAMRQKWMHGFLY